MPVNSSLVLDAIPTPPADDSMPDRATCLMLLEEIDTAWKRGAPFSHAANATRPAVKMLALKHRLKQDKVRKLIDLWLVNEVIAEEVYDAKDKVKGYRKLINI